MTTDQDPPIPPAEPTSPHPIKVPLIENSHPLTEEQQKALREYLAQEDVQAHMRKLMEIVARAAYEAIKRGDYVEPNSSSDCDDKEANHE